jgi:hypothetical protein
MRTPVVTEVVRRLEALTADPFIERISNPSCPPPKRPATNLAEPDADAHRRQRTRVSASLATLAGRDKPTHRRWAAQASPNHQ